MFVFLLQLIVLFEQLFVFSSDFVLFLFQLLDLSPQLLLTLCECLLQLGCTFLCSFGLDLAQLILGSDVQDFLVFAHESRLLILEQSLEDLLLLSD